MPCCGKGFSFNSYVYCVTRDFIASTRAFNLLTRAFNLPTRAFNLSTRAFNLATRAFSLLTRGFELVTRVFELVTCELELVTRGSELITHVLLFHITNNRSEKFLDKFAKMSKIGTTVERLNADSFSIFCQNYQKICFEKLARNSSLIGDTSEVFSKFTKFPVAIVSGDKAFFAFHVIT